MLLGSPALQTRSCEGGLPRQTQAIKQSCDRVSAHRGCRRLRERLVDLSLELGRGLLGRHGPRQSLSRLGCGAQLFGSLSHRGQAPMQPSFSSLHHDLELAGGGRLVTCDFRRTCGVADLHVSDPAGPTERVGGIVEQIPGASVVSHVDQAAILRQEAARERDGTV